MPLLIAQFEFEVPVRLVVLLLLPAVVFIALAVPTTVGRWRRFTLISLRLILLGLLVLAWAQPIWRGTSAVQKLFIVMDESASTSGAMPKTKRSIEDIMAARGTNEVQVISFAAAAVESEVAASQLRGSAPGTNIESALNLALASGDSTAVAQILLLSDGRQTAGKAIRAAASSAVPISTMIVDAFALPEVAVDRIETPSRAIVGSAASVNIELVSNRRTRGLIKFLVDGKLQSERNVECDAGRTNVNFDLAVTRVPQQLRAEITGFEDQFNENNSLSSVLLSETAPTVLLIANDVPQEASLGKAIEDAGLNVQTAVPAEFSAEEFEGANIDVIVVSNVTSALLGPAALRKIESWVTQAGKGLIVVGGEPTFGVAALELTPLEKLLPIAATEAVEEPQKSLAMVLVIDKSLSMLEERRLDLAKEAAKKVAEVLQPQDQVGVLAFGNESEWVSPLAAMSNKEELLQRIDALKASGLTVMYPAIERAYLALRQCDADRKYAIVLTDGVPTPGDFSGVAKRMSDAGITVSTVSLGKGADQMILSDVARIAKGNHFHVDNPQDLPKIIERETRSAANTVAATQYIPRLERRLPGFDLAQIPPLGSYVMTRPKAGATLLMSAGDGDPLLAWQRLGRGLVIALPADLTGRAGDAWRTWSGYGPLWRRLVQEASPPQSAKPLELSFQQHDGTITAVLDVRSTKEQTSGAWANGLTPALRLSVVASGEKANVEQLREFPMKQVAPGRYTATFRGQFGECYVAEAVAEFERDATGVQRGLAVDYPEEFRLQPSNVELLQTIAATTGGTFEPKPSEVFSPDGRTVETTLELWPYALMGAIVVLLLEVAARRWPIAMRSTVGKGAKNEAA